MSVFVSWILLHTACTLRYAVSATPARAAESASTRPPPRTMATSPAVLHDRHDVPGLRHRRRIETDTADRAAARVAVVPMGAVIIATTIDAVAMARTLTRFQAGEARARWAGCHRGRPMRFRLEIAFTPLVRDPRGRLTERRAPDRARIARRLPPRHPRWRVRGAAGRRLRVRRLSRSLNSTWEYLRDGSPGRASVTFAHQRHCPVSDPCEIGDCRSAARGRGQPYALSGFQLSR